MAPQSPRGTVLSTSVGLTCGGVGLVREIIYEKNQAPPSLPVTLLVDFKVGGFYRGISWLGDADGVDTDDVRVVKFAPKRDDFKTAYHGVRADKQKACYRTQFPLRLAWARTIHKSQGLSLEHVVGDIGNAEFSTGLTHVLLSRVTSHDGLYLDPFPTFKRFNAIKGKIEDRQLHEKDLEQLFYDTVLADLRAAGISRTSTASEITATSKSTKIFVPWAGRQGERRQEQQVPARSK